MTALYLAIYLGLGGLALFALAVLVIVGDWLWMQHRARRNERQVRADMAMRRGFRELKRRGWVEDDLT